MCRLPILHCMHILILKGLPNRRIQAIMNKRPAAIRAFEATTVSLNAESTQSGTTGRVILIHHLQNISRALIYCF